MECLVILYSRARALQYAWDFFLLKFKATQHTEWCVKIASARTNNQPEYVCVCTTERDYLFYHDFSYLIISREKSLPATVKNADRTPPNKLMRSISLCSIVFFSFSFSLLGCNGCLSTSQPACNTWCGHVTGQNVVKRDTVNQIVVAFPIVFSLSLSLLLSRIICIFFTVFSAFNSFHFISFIKSNAVAVNNNETLVRYHQRSDMYTYNEIIRNCF